MALTTSDSRVCRYVIATLISSLAVACGGDGATDSEPVLVSLSVSPASLNVGLGQTRTATVNFTRQGKGNSPVTPSIPFQLPAGVTLTFDPSVITAGTASVTLTVTVASDAQPGRLELPIIVTGADIVGGQPPVLVVTMFPPQVTVTRAGPGSGTVTSNPSGINCGSTCTASFQVLPLTLTAAPASGSTFDGWSGACVGTTTTCTFTPTTGSGSSNNVTATFTAPSFTLAITPTSVSLAQGANTSVTANITRVGGFTGAVNLGFGTVPPGLTITPSPLGITGASATFSIAAAASLGAGTYPITITATATGVSNQAVTLPVQVTPAPGGNGNIAFSFASCDPGQVPIWFAVQNGSGAWTRVMPGGNSTFTFAITSTGGIAWVTRRANFFTTTVWQLSASEALSIASGSICANSPQSGTRSLTSSVLNSGSPTTITVVLGAAATTFSSLTPPATGLSFALSDFPSGQRDLIAARKMIISNGTTQLQRLVLRRNTSYATGATLPSISLTGPESFIPMGRNIALSNLGTDQSFISESFKTTNGSSESFFESVGTFAPNLGSDVVPWGAVPDSLLQPGDFHSFLIAAAPTGNSTSGRFAWLLLHAPPAAGPASITLGPAIIPPAVTSLGTTPNVRMRAQLASQSAYNAAAFADFTQDTNSVELVATAGYTSGAPATWTMDIPDLAGAGYDAAWGLRSGMSTHWEVGAVGGNLLPFIGAAPFDGAQMIGAAASSAPSAFMKLIQARRGRLP